MYLKQMELTGFKSFCEKTRLNFDPGIIAIVGPNGCGKTNIVDAIRWSLGEQSAKSLRGKSMEDVIFHGTSERKGLGMAEISLTIDNSQKLLPIEFSEVTITRRVFRSGEGQYFINRNICRLKDIENLFMDTGVGTRAYSVMEQGKMDLILSSKPEDRRYVFEEAAGITKYKEQKRETMRKLEIAENNLIRLNDIIKEVQRQIGSIERQAAKARRYKNLREELRELEIKTHTKQLEDLKQKYTECEEEKNEIAQESKQVHSAVEEREEIVRSLRARIQHYTAEAMTLQNERSSIETRLATSEQQIKYKTEKANEIKARSEIITQQCQNLLEEINSTQMLLKDVLRELDIASHEKGKRKQVLYGKKQEIDDVLIKTKEIRKNIDSKSEELLDSSSKESRLKNDLSRIELEIKGLLLKERKDAVEISKKNKHLQELIADFEKTEKIIDVQRKSLQILKYAVKERDEKIILFKDDVLNVQKNIQEKNNEIAEKHSQYEIFSTQKKEYEGCPDGTKYILENKWSFSGVKCMVSDLIKVPPQYTAAIESALKDITQGVIVDTLINTIFAAETVKDMRFSKTTFITLELIENKNETSCTEMPKDLYLARALDIVEYDDVYKGTIGYLLRDVYIVKDAECAKKILDLKLCPVMLVTIDGTIFSSEGIIKAGVNSKTFNVISRDSEIEKLKIYLSSASEEIYQLMQKQKMLDDKLKQEEGQLDGAKNNLYREEVNLGILENDLIKTKEEIQQTEEDLQVLESEISDSTDEKERLVKKENESRAELEKISGLTANISANLQELSDEMKRCEQTRAIRENGYTELKISLIGAEERENHLSFKNDQFHAKLSSANENIINLKKEKSENEIILGNLTEEILNAEKYISEFSGIKLELNQKIRDVSNNSENAEKELLQYEDSIYKERTLREKLNQNLSEKQLKLAELRMKIDDILRKLHDEYKADMQNLASIASIASIEIKGINPEELDSRILALKEKLESMGEVSLVAIEEHEKLQERYEFMTVQRQDLVGAKESLLKAIAKINSTTKKLFSDTFQEIRNNFNELFVRLFKGGKADLILLDESDILESGIEIIARPPGKRLQNVSLLSGGEKALTAIALMFAMFKVKPSPFCILDELDAPLDDSNIERFIQLLKEFSKTSQFLIVTHNKRTIAASQALYGITMQESGVSKVVSVRLPEKTDQPKVHHV